MNNTIYSGGLMTRYSSDTPYVVYGLIEKYQEYIDRIASQKDNNRSLGSLSSLKGLVSSGYSLYKSVKKIKSGKKYNNNILDFSINNLTENSLVLYKVDNLEDNTNRGKYNLLVQNDNAIIPSDNSINLTINNINFRQYNGPRFHFMMDDGKNTLFFIIRFGYKRSSVYVDRIAHLRIESIAIYDTSLNDFDSDEPIYFNSYDLTTQLWEIKHNDFKKPFYVLAPPISSDMGPGSINLSFI